MMGKISFNSNTFQTTVPVVLEKFNFSFEAIFPSFVVIVREVIRTHFLSH